jgi:hypothetical protein
MLGLLQLLLAIFGIYSALQFSEEVKLAIPLVCLFAMLLVSRFEKRNSEKKSERKIFLQSEMDKTSKKQSKARIFLPSTRCSGPKVNYY